MRWNLWFVIGVWLEGQNSGYQHWNSWPDYQMNLDL